MTSFRSYILNHTFCENFLLYLYGRVEAIRQPQLFIYLCEYRLSWLIKQKMDVSLPLSPIG